MSSFTITDCLQSVVLPVLRAMLKDDELTGIEMRARPNGHGDAAFVLKVQCGKDIFELDVFDPHTMPNFDTRQLVDHLKYNFQDFVAESSFGWGEWRS